jgi:hypothetical protein
VTGVVQGLVTTVFEAIDKSTAKSLAEAQKACGSLGSPREKDRLAEIVKENLLDSFLTSLLPEIPETTMCMEKFRDLFLLALNCGERYLSDEGKKEVAGVLLAYLRSGRPYSYPELPPRQSRNLSEVVRVRPSGKTVRSLMKELAQLPEGLLVEPLTLSVMDYRTPGERLKVEPALY